MAVVFLRAYIEESWTNRTTNDNNFQSVKNIRHQAYCDSHWDSTPPVDEERAFCEQWTCPEGFFRCKTGQCITLRWLCDGEWDCSDASDEQGIFVYKDIFYYNPNISDLQDTIEKCRKHYAKQPFGDFCNISTEFPCLLSNITDPLNIISHRPCINLTLIGDGIDHCHGGLDERNTASGCMSLMKGFDFHCAHDSVCISYLLTCSQRCLTPEDDHPLCFYKGTNNLCLGPSDVICLNGTCIPKAQMQWRN